MPRVTVSGSDVVGRHQRERQRFKFSNFLVTINTNVRPQSQEAIDSLAPTFADTLRYLLSHEGLSRIISFGKAGDDYYSGALDNVDAKFNMEVGENTKGGRLHSHITIFIKHHSFIRLVTSEIQNIVQEHMELPHKPHVDIRIIRGNENALEYLQKMADSYSKQGADDGISQEEGERIRVD